MRQIVLSIAGGLLLTLLSLPLHAQQKIVDSSFNSWFMMMNEFRFGPKWYLSNEIHIRRADGLQDWQQFLLRPALNYRLTQAVELSAGYSYVLTYPYGEQAVVRNIPEHNVWQQLLLRHNAGKVGFMHRYRLEERFVGNVVEQAGTYVLDGTNYSERFRYRLTARAPLYAMGEGKELFVAAFDEIWVNMGDGLMVESFNQNWFYVGLGYQFSPMGNIQAGYLDQIIRKADNIHYERNPTVSVTLFYNIDFVK